MNRLFSALILVSILSFAGTAQEQDGASSKPEPKEAPKAKVVNKPARQGIGAGSIGFGYGEGLMAKYLILDDVSIYGSFNFGVRGADSVYSQPLHNGALKIGAAYKFLDFTRLHVNAFAEFMESYSQFEAKGIRPADDQVISMRYNVWDTKVRAGVMPEFFLTRNLSIYYAFGLEMVYNGNHYQLNDKMDDTESLKNDYTSFGVFGAGDDIASSLAHNFGLVVYIR